MKCYLLYNDLNNIISRVPDSIVAGSCNVNTEWCDNDAYYSPRDWSNN
jgi:hypothetical protein